MTRLLAACRPIHKIQSMVLLHCLKGIGLIWPRLCWGISGVCAAALMNCLGCAAIYPEIDTPIGPPPNAETPSPAPPDDYVYLYIKSARMPSQTRDGRKWGKGGEGLPNPYAILFIDGTEINRTAVEENTLQPTWPNQKKANYQMPSKRRLRVEVWDDHGLFPHPICLKEMQNLASYVDIGEAEIDCDGGAHITLGVEPAHAVWGLGFYFALGNSTAYVTRVIAASAAGRAGLKDGDQILSIMDRRVAEMEGGEIQSLIRSNSATGVEIGISAAPGPSRFVTLKDEAIYPLVQDHIPLN